MNKLLLSTLLASTLFATLCSANNKVVDMMATSNPFVHDMTQQATRFWVQIHQGERRNPAQVWKSFEPFQTQMSRPIDQSFKNLFYSFGVAYGSSDFSPTQSAGQIMLTILTRYFKETAWRDASINTLLSTMMIEDLPHQKIYTLMLVTKNAKSAHSWVDIWFTHATSHADPTGAQKNEAQQAFCAALMHMGIRKPNNGSPPGGENLFYDAPAGIKAYFKDQVQDDEIPSLARMIVYTNSEYIDFIEYVDTDGEGHTSRTNLLNRDHASWVRSIQKELAYDGISAAKQSFLISLARLVTID